MVIFLAAYKGSLHPDFYSKFFRDLFGRFYVLETNNGPMQINELDYDVRANVDKFVNKDIFTVDNP